jgi:hypothetical protein
MKVGLKAFTTFMALAFVSMPISNAVAQTTVALHATQDEINVWKQRRLSGPYLEDWNRIISNANSFKSSPSQGSWLGNQSATSAWAGAMVATCQRLPTVYPNGNSSDCNGNYSGASKVRDAGFVWMLTGDTSYRDPVIDFLLRQIVQAGTDFSNSSRWSTSYSNQDQDFAISIWARELAYAYSYVRHSMSTQQKADVDTWFNKMGVWLNQVVHNSAVKRYPNRLSDDYSVVGASCTALSDGSLTHFAGYTPTQFGYPWDNKAANHNAAVAAIGATTGNKTLLTSAKRFVKEWLRIMVYPDGTVWDQRRWFVSGSPQSGYSYLTAATGSVISAADHIARTGDTELYTWTTSDGRCGSAGGNKGLLLVLKNISNMALGNTLKYASLTQTNDPAKIIQPAAPDGSRHYIYEIAMAQANVFYKDTLIARAVSRPKPASPSHGGYNPWGGDWGNLPGALFMFSQMEGKVWPYSAQNMEGMSPPSNLTVTAVE